MLALTHAWTRRRGLEGYADGLSLIGQALALYWDELWPALTENGEEDPFYRINALAELSDKSTSPPHCASPFYCVAMAMS
jgi:type VI secretion system protein ImpA